MGIYIKNQIVELKKFNKYHLSDGYYAIPDNVTTEKVIKEAIEAHPTWTIIHEDVYFNENGEPVVGLGTFYVGPADLLED